MDEGQIIQYAPYVIIAVMFCANYKIFITPSELDRKLHDYVLKETYSVAYQEMKADLKEMKEKIDKMYDKIFGID